MSGLRDALRSFLRVWVFTTIGLWIPGLLGWINEVTSWARAEGTTPFPDARGLGFIFVAAITAAFPAAVATLVRWIENTTGRTLLPRASGPPTPATDRGDRGAIDSGIVLVLAVLGAIVLIVWIAGYLR